MVGSRRYSKIPTLLSSLSSKVRVLALTALGSGVPCCHAIEGVILILTWPGPVDNNTADATFTLAGLLIHAAMQLGLHMPALSQDFARIPIKTTDEDIRIRTKKWAYCLLAYYRYKISALLDMTYFANDQTGLPSSKGKLHRF